MEDDDLPPKEAAAPSAAELAHGKSDSGRVVVLNMKPVASYNSTLHLNDALHTCACTQPRTARPFAPGRA